MSETTIPVMPAESGKKKPVALYVILAVLALGVIVEGVLLYRAHNKLSNPEKTVDALAESIASGKEGFVTVKDEAGNDIQVVKRDARGALKTEMDSVSYTIGLNLGYQLQEQYNNKEFKFDTHRVLQGMFEFIDMYADHSEENPVDPNSEAFMKSFRVNIMENNPLNAFFMRKQEEAQKKAEEERAKLAAENLQKGQAFLEENAKKEGVQVSESGLQYIILDPGNDKRADENQKINVKYKGSYIDGEVFDDSGDETRQFTRAGVVKGFGEGLSLVGEGGHIMLYIPAELGYGEGNYRIGPNQVLVFDVTLVSIEK